MTSNISTSTILCEEETIACLKKVGVLLTSASTAATAAAATVTSSTTTEGVAAHISELRGDLLLGFTQDIKEISSLLVVVGGKEGNGGTRSTKR